MIQRLLGQCTVTDLERSEGWYVRLLAREPDARPMPGLLEWRLSATFGLQVWAEPDRAGSSTVVLEVDDLDAEGERLRAAGIDLEGPVPGGGARILPLADPDGNRVVLTGQ